MAIQTHGHEISTIMTSSIMGHSGGGMFPLTLLPAYRRLMQVIKEAGVTNLTKSSTAYQNFGNFILLNPLTWKYLRRIGDDAISFCTLTRLNSREAEKIILRCN